MALPDFARRATTLRLDGSSFDSCLSSGRHDDAIRASLRQGEELGVTGTPAYFVRPDALGRPPDRELHCELADAELAGR